MGLQKLLPTGFILQLLFLSSAYALTEDDSDDFWLLLDVEPVQNVVWLFAGRDESDGRYYGVAADLVVTDPLHFIFSATRQDYFVESEEISWGFNGAINESFSLGLFKDFWGKRDSLEKNDIRMLMTFYRAGFNAQLSYETGDVELFLKQGPRIQRSSISTDHSAAELSFGYRWPQFYWQLSHKKHNYQQDISLLLLRPRLLLIVSSIGIQQASALAEKESSALLGYQQEQTFYEITFSKIKSAINNEINDYVTARISTALNTELQLAVDVELPVNDVPWSTGLSLGILW